MNSLWTSLPYQHYFNTDYTRGEEGRKAGHLSCQTSTVKVLWTALLLCLKAFHQLSREHGAAWGLSFGSYLGNKKMWFECPPLCSKRESAGTPCSTPVAPADGFKFMREKRCIRGYETIFSNIWMDINFKSMHFREHHLALYVCKWLQSRWVVFCFVFFFSLCYIWASLAMLHLTHNWQRNQQDNGQVQLHVTCFLIICFLREALSSLTRWIFLIQFSYTVFLLLINPMIFDETCPYVFILMK